MICVLAHGKYLNIREMATGTVVVKASVRKEQRLGGDAERKQLDWIPLSFTTLLIDRSCFTCFVVVVNRPRVFFFLSLVSCLNNKSIFQTVSSL